MFPYKLQARLACCVPAFHTLQNQTINNFILKKASIELLCENFTWNSLHIKIKRILKSYPMDISWSKFYSISTDSIEWKRYVYVISGIANQHTIWVTLSVNLFLTSSSSEPLPEPSVGPLDTSNWKLKKMKLHGKNKSFWKIYIIYSIYQFSSSENSSIN